MDRLPSIAGTMAGTDIATQRVLNGMVSLELTSEPRTSLANCYK